MMTQDYQFLSRFLMESSGLYLGEGKEYLLNSRLNPIVRQHGWSSVSELVTQLRSPTATALRKAVTEAMTTNETLFFRDQIPFDELKTVTLPELIAARRTTRSLRLWSAASSTGQEAYSFAMLLSENFPELDSWRVEIMATDLSEDALNRGRAGLYSKFEVERGLSPRQIERHFEAEGNQYRIQPRLRKLVTWKQQNLLENFSYLGMFDVIFCRNVLIYFDSPTKTKILGELSRRLNTDGALFLGAAETVLGISDKFERDRRYRTAAYHLVGARAPVTV